MKLAGHLWFLAGGGVRGDAVYYFGMGRGLLNGLRLYVDLFETKPPLVFWLSALSLAAGGDARLYLAAQAALLVCVPPALSAVVLRGAGAGSNRRAAAALLVLLWGAALASFAADRGQGFQTEGFAVLPAAVPALVLVWSRDGVPGQRGTWLSGAALAIAMLLKEPFLLSAVAALAWAAAPRRDLLWAVRVVALAGLLALLFLLATGAAGGYLGTYLPEIMKGRLYDNLVYHDYRIDAFVQVPTPLWVRGLDTARLVRDVVPATPFAPLGVATALLIAGRPLWSGRSRWWWRLAAAAGVVALAACAQKGYDLRQVSVLIDQLGRPLPWGDPFFRWKLLEVAALGAAGAAALATLARARQWGPLAEAARALAVLYLATLVTGLAGDHPAHHALFALPVYLAAVADGLTRWGRGEGGRPATALVAAAAVLLVAGAASSRYDHGRLRAEQAALVAEQRLARAGAERLDALLTACGEARYVLADHRAQVLQALTRHSPVQLTYGMQRAHDDPGHLGFRSRPANPAFRAKMARDLASTRVIVFAAGTGRVLTVPGVEELLAHRGTAPPGCARPFLPVPGLVVDFQRAGP